MKYKQNDTFIYHLYITYISFVTTNGTYKLNMYIIIYIHVL